MIEIIDINEIRNIEMGILKEIHSFCAIKNIRYSLWGGSLLGAIRHSGFIPWDDDIDICMMRKDYEYFCKNFCADRYEVQCCENNKNYPYSFAKVFDKMTIKYEDINTRKDFSIGIDVDVFPIDIIKGNVSINEKEIIKRRKNIKKWGRLIGKSPNKIKNYIKRIYGLFSDCNSIAKDINKRAKMFSDSLDTDEKYMLYADTNLKSPLIMDKSIFINLSLHQFETEQFYIPEGYDELLSLCYGNYMKLPPIDKRITHHNFKAFWL